MHEICIGQKPTNWNEAQNKTKQNDIIIIITINEDNGNANANADTKYTNNKLSFAYLETFNKKRLYYWKC